MIDAVTPPRPTLARALRRAVARILVLGAVLFTSAGTLRWPAAWALLAVFSVWSLFITTYLLKHDPALLEERLSLKLVQEGQKGWDKVFSIVSLIAGLPVIVLPGLDAVRFQWTRLPPVVQALGLVGFIPALALTFVVMRENTFLSRVVKIDAARGHRVITTGPYQRVRHPMYVAAIAVMLCWPLALGSLLTLIPSGLLAALIVIRTHLEDRTLHEELPGYREYAQRTRYRLLPGVW